MVNLRAYILEKLKDNKEAKLGTPKWSMCVTDVRGGKARVTGIQAG